MPKWTTRQLDEIYRRSGGKCIHCRKQFSRNEHGAKRHQWNVEHQIPRSIGGPDALDNLAVACVPCNASKGNKFTALDFSKLANHIRGNKPPIQKGQRHQNRRRYNGNRQSAPRRQYQNTGNYNGRRQPTDAPLYQNKNRYNERHQSAPHRHYQHNRQHHGNRRGHSETGFAIGGIAALGIAVGALLDVAGMDAMVPMGTIGTWVALGFGYWWQRIRQ